MTGKIALSLMPIIQPFSVITYPLDDDFTHIYTATYRNIAMAGIFGIITRNRDIMKMVNQGIRRMRAYIQKRIRDRLKRVIKDKKKLNEAVRRITNKIFKYFKVYETHESNYIHVHILENTLTCQDQFKIISYS
jgi:hypothetical protein